MIDIEILEQVELDRADAEAWVEVALAEVKVLRHYDDRLAFAAGDADGKRVAKQLLRCWQVWIEHAECLVDRASRLRTHVYGLYDLRYHLGRARGLVGRTKLPPADILAP